MRRSRKLIHPNFVIGLISYIALFIGVLMHTDGTDAGKTVIIGSLILGLLHWLGSIVTVSRDKLKKQDESLWYFWFLSVLIIPPLGGMIYYMVNDKRISV